MRRLPKNEGKEFLVVFYQKKTIGKWAYLPEKKLEIHQALTKCLISETVICAIKNLRVNKM